MVTLELQWKQFSLSLPAVRAWIDANLTAECVGLSANNKLEVHFSEEPSQTDKDALQAYWDGLDENSTEAQEYTSMQAILADKAAKAASAKAKLAALGLTQEEIEAILG